jgi:hypothetical protein
MKKFRFSLEAVLRQERRQEKVRIGELTAIRERVAEALRRRDGLVARIDGLRVSGGADMSVIDFRERNRYIAELLEAKRGLDASLRILREQEATQLGLVRETRMRIKMLENIREKQRELHQGATRREEERTLEDIMASTHVRTRAAGERPAESTAAPDVPAMSSSRR